jgi:SWIM zinc finger
MIAVIETTEWEDGADYNQVYLLDGDRIIAHWPKYAVGPTYLKVPLKINRRGRKFRELPQNPFEAIKPASRVVKVTGSKGSIYEVDLDAETCTCPGFSFRGRCRHVQAAQQ